MAHKVHPKIFRIKNLSDWYSRWYNNKEFRKELEEDYRIREYLEKKLRDCGVESIEIERFPGKIKVIINSARPGLIIGRGGRGLEEIQKEIKNKILGKKEPKELKIEIKEIRNIWLYSSLVGQWIAQRLEKRMPYRRVIKQALDNVLSQKEVKGARIEVSGRLDGAEIARSEKIGQGALPRQTIRADIDYAHEEAFCPYGVIGIKVWIYKGEKFD
ncbi:30S ribosomal protein S3 [bacterium]|nr:30S ribosomal protein S3 [bacterium]